MSDFQINLVCCTQVICDQVAIKQATQKDIALTYAMAIKSAAQNADDPDWGAINRAILARWKMSGLERIKKRAFDILRGGASP
jgi:hypothetical protein